MKSSEKYIFKYNGDLEYIDINTLLVSQFHFTEVLNIVKDQIAPSEKLDIKVKPLPKGSFQIELLLDIDLLANLFSKENIQLASAVMIIAVGIYQLKEFLKGEKPKRVEEVDNKTIIHSNDGSIEVNYNVYKIYRDNSQIDRAIKKGMEPIISDDEVNGIEIQKESNRETIFKIERDNFEGFAKEVQISNNDTKFIIESEVVLSVFKVVFEKGYKWQFYYKGNKINANIQDENFIKQIEDGSISFASGDNLVSDLKINQEYEKIANTYVNKSYEVVKVHKHIPRGGTEQMNFKDLLY